MTNPLGVLERFCVSLYGTVKKGRWLKMILFVTDPCKSGTSNQSPSAWCCSCQQNENVFGKEEQKWRRVSSHLKVSLPQFWEIRRVLKDWWELGWFRGQGSMHSLQTSLAGPALHVLSHCSISTLECGFTLMKKSLPKSLRKGTQVPSGISPVHTSFSPVLLGFFIWLLCLSLPWSFRFCLTDQPAFVRGYVVKE